MPEFTGHRDIRSYIRVIWRWKLLIVVLVVGAPVVAYLLERGKPNQYSATATVSPNSSGTVATTGTSVFQTDNIDALSQLITTSSVATVAGAELKPPQTGSEAVDGVSTRLPMSPTPLPPRSTSTVPNMPRPTSGRRSRPPRRSSQT